MTDWCLPENKLESRFFNFFNGESEEDTGHEGERAKARKRSSRERNRKRQAAERQIHGNRQKRVNC